MSNSDGSLGGLMKAFRSIARRDANIAQDVDRQEGRDRNLGLYNVPEDDLQSRGVDVSSHPSPIDGDDGDFDPDADTEVAEFPLGGEMPWDDEPIMANNRSPSGLRVGAVRHRTTTPPRPVAGHFADDDDVLALDDDWDEDSWG